MATGLLSEIGMSVLSGFGLSVLGSALSGGARRRSGLRGSGVTRFGGGGTDVLRAGGRRRRGLRSLQGPAGAGGAAAACAGRSGMAARDRGMGADSSRRLCEGGGGRTAIAVAVSRNQSRGRGRPIGRCSGVPTLALHGHARSTLRTRSTASKQIAPSTIAPPAIVWALGTSSKTAQTQIGASTTSVNVRKTSTAAGTNLAP